MFDRIRKLLKPIVATQAASNHERHDQDRSGLLKAQGDALLAVGEATQATRLFRSAVELDPANVLALIALGHALWKLGLSEEATSALESALSIDEGSVDAHYLLALVRQDSGDLPGAIEHLERLIDIGAGIADAHTPLYKAYVGAARMAEAKATAERALQWCRQAAEADPGNAEFLNDAGLALRDMKLLAEALAFFEQALRTKPAFAAALNNRGLVLHELDRHDEALAEYDRVLQMDDTLGEVHANRGNTLRELNRHEEALGSYERTQAIGEREDLFLNESLSRLVLGDLSAGWQKYEWRWQSVGRTHPKDQFAMPLWLGTEDLNGKTIFLYAEQGLGDTIQLCRYVKSVSNMGATVVLGVQRSLVPVLEGLEGVDRIIALGPDVPAPTCDYHCPLLSLPLAFRTSLATIPRRGAYIRPAGPAFAARLEAWRARLGPSDLLRVGVVWSGNADHTNDKNRSIPLADFVRIFSSRVRFIALQNDVRAADAPVLKERADLEYVGSELVDFAETAALITQLDLVVSVDTSVAHLAAAMGKPVWVLVSFNPDWRWLLDRDDSPWYETVRLFRQSRRGDWSDVLATVGREIEKLAILAASGPPS